MRRSTVDWLYGFKNLFRFSKKWSKSSYTCLWTKEIIFRNEQEGKWIDAPKNDTPPWQKRSFLTWTIWEHEVWWSGEYFARIQHSWTRANPPVNPTCCKTGVTFLTRLVQFFWLKPAIVSSNIYYRFEVANAAPDSVNLSCRSNFAQTSL